MRQFCPRVAFAVLLAAFWMPANHLAAQPAPPAKPAEEKRSRVDARGDPLPEAALMRLGSGRMRHGGHIDASALAPDGKTLATSGLQSVVIWDLDTGKLVRRFPVDHSGRYSRPGLYFSSDGTLLAYLRHSHFACIWDLKNGKEIHRFEPPKNLNKRVDFNEMLGSHGRFVNRDKELLFATHQAIRSLDLETKQVSVILPDTGTSEFSPDGKQFLREEKESVIVGEVATGKVVAKLDVAAHLDGKQDGLAFAPDGRSLAVIHDHKELQHRKLPGGELLATFPLPKTAIFLLPEPVGRGTVYWAYRLFFSADGRFLHLGTSQGTIHRYDLASRKELPTLNQPGSEVRGVHILADGRTLVSTSNDGLIRRWDLAALRKIPEPNVYEGNTAAAYSSDGQWAALADGRGRIDLWDVRTGAFVRTLREEGAAATHLAFAPDSNLLAGAERSGTVRFWKIPSGEAGAVWPHEPVKGEWFCNGIHFSPDGRLISITDYPRQTRVVEVASEKLVWVGSGNKSVFSADGGSLVIGARGGPTLSFVDTKSWKTRQNVRMYSRSSEMMGVTFTLAFAPDSRRFAAIFDAGSLAICDGRTGEEVHRLGTVEIGRPIEQAILGEKLKNRPQAIAFSADGKWLASGGSDTVISIWDVLTGKEVSRLTGHDGEITTLAFRPDGRTLSSFATEGQGYLWDLTPKAAAGPRVSVVQLWEALKGDDATAAFRAQWQMIAAANESATFLQEQLKPVPRADAGKVQQWIADLGSEKFTVREAASKELTKVGEQVQVPIDEALAGDVTLEVRRRLKSIVDAVTTAPGPETVRVIRAIMILERIGTPEARHVLEALAKGAPGDTTTEESASALKRLAKLRS